MDRKAQSDTAHKALKYKYKYFQLKQLHQAQSLSGDAKSEDDVQIGGGEKEKHDQYFVSYIVKPCDGGKTQHFTRQLKVVLDSQDEAQKVYDLLYKYALYWERQPVFSKVKDLEFEKCIIITVSEPERVDTKESLTYDPVRSVPHPAALQTSFLPTSVHEQITTDDGSEKKSLIIENPQPIRINEKIVKPIPSTIATSIFPSRTNEKSDKTVTFGNNAVDIVELERKAKEMTFVDPTPNVAVGGRRIHKIGGVFKSSFGMVPLSSLKAQNHKSSLDSTDSKSTSESTEISKSTTESSEIIKQIEKEQDAGAITPVETTVSETTTISNTTDLSWNDTSEVKSIESNVNYPEQS